MVLPVFQRGYRIHEAAQYLGVTPWYIETRIRSKELPALRLGRHYTILREDLDTFLDRQRRLVATAPVASGKAAV